MLVPRLARHDVVALILAAACWGVGTVISKQAVAEVPPFTLLAGQLAMSLGFLTVVGYRRGDRMPPGREGRLLGRLGLLNPGIAYALSLVGLTQISASYSVLLWTLEPILIVVLAGLVLGERIGATFVVLSGLAITGLVVVLYDPNATAALGGVALTVAGVCCCAIYTVAARRWLPRVDATVPIIVAQEAYALAVAVILVSGAAAAGISPLPTGLTAMGVASTIGSGLLYYGLAYWFYLTGLRRMPASVAAAAFYLIPVFGVAAASLLGDRLTVVQWVGATLVVGAVATLTVRTAESTAQPE
jgi:probable blue pigment (indigoidine) exporter